MEPFKAELTGVSRNYKTGAFDITVSTDGLPDGLDDLKGDLSVTIKRWREHRTLTANAYYWALIGKLAAKLTISVQRCHNLMLRRYGQLAIIDGELIGVRVPDTEDAEKKVLEASNYHLRMTSEAQDGIRTYYMLRGSSDYDSKEFSDLLEGTISECKEVGIETLPPEEIERMMAAYA